MDLLKSLAETIADMTGKRVEIEPSQADIKAEHFIISLQSFWIDPEGTMRNEGYSMQENGLGEEGYKQALPVKVVYRSTSSGETWRSQVLQDTKEFAKRFSSVFRIAIAGGKLKNKALERVENIVPDLVNNDDIHGIGFLCELNRALDEDQPFVMIEENGRTKTYVAEMVWNGYIIFEESQEVLT